MTVTAGNPKRHGSTDNLKERILPNLSIHNPTAAPGAGQAPEMAHVESSTLKSLQGKVVGFGDNSKPNFSLLADDMAMLLQREHGVKMVVRHQKRTSTMAAGADVIRDMVAECDLVIAGSGD